nr:zinc finger, CCHC-type [Tanacetum cinerariifolium]
YKLTYLEHPIPVALIPTPGHVLPQDVFAAHRTWVKAFKEIGGLKFMIMVPELQKNLEQLDGQSASLCVLKMKSHIDNLERLGHHMSLNLAVGLILVSLSKEYDGFMHNYNMHGMGKTVNELHVMLKLHEQTLLKTDDALALHAIRADSPPLKKDNPAKDAIFHQCGEGLKGSKKLKPGALNLYVGNDHHATIEAIRTLHLCLPNVYDSKSQTGYVFILIGGDVEWESTKHNILATSSIEAEYIAALDASEEAVWVRKFIFGLGVVPINEVPMKMYYGNTEAITIANELGITKGFLATIHDTTSDVPSIHDHLVVFEFPDVFPDELPAIPPVRE